MKWYRSQGRMLLIDILSMVYSAFVMKKKTMSSGGTTHIGLGAPTSVTSQENVPQTCLQAVLLEAIPQLRFPLLRILWFVSSGQKLTSTSSVDNSLLCLAGIATGHFEGLMPSG